MNDIKDIYKINYNQEAQFRGTLRNERKFVYGQKVFIGSGSGNNIMVYPAIVRGIKDDEDLSNPTFIYKLEIPKWVVVEEENKYYKSRIGSYNNIKWYKFLLRFNVWKYKKGLLNNKSASYKNLRCDKIFNNINEAKESVLRNHETITSLERDNIDRYFKNFDNKN